MSNGYWNYAAQNNSYDWNVVLAGTGTLKTTTPLGLGQAFHFLNHPNAPSSTQWVELVGDGATQLSGLLPSGASLSPSLTANKTVTIPAGSTTSEVQALIDAESKNLGEYTLTFRYEDGAYSSGQLNLSGFVGNVVLAGNVTDNSVSSTKQVNINMAADQYIYCSSCTNVSILYIRFNGYAHTTTLSNIIYGYQCGSLDVRYCTVRGTGTYGRVLVQACGVANIRDGYFYDMGYAVSGLNSNVHISNTTLSSNTIDVRADNCMLICSSALSTYLESNSGSVRDSGGFKS